MTDETRKELRAVFEAAVRAGGADFCEVPGGAGNYYELSVFSPTVYSHPELTTAQQLALSVLLGEPDAAVLSALCDVLIENGHEYAVECHYIGRREGKLEAVTGLYDFGTITAISARAVGVDLVAYCQGADISQVVTG